MNKVVGVLTAGGDSPGLNAAIRGLTKAAQGVFNMHIIGFRDGFRGLMENRAEPLDRSKTSGLLTVGGTILGTSREKRRQKKTGKKKTRAHDNFGGTGGSQNRRLLVSEKVRNSDIRNSDSATLQVPCGRFI